MQEARAIALPLPFRMGSVNCYLVGTDGNFVLVDTGPSSGRAVLERTLVGAGCVPESLRLIIITHGDFDHTGNAAYLRAKFGAPIAMHAGDAGMAERGDMFWGRKSGNGLIRALAPALFRFGKPDRFTSDVLMEDGFDFAAYGFDAKAIALPGHSIGSLGVLTADGDLFCGDLLDNTKRPALNSIMDDVEAGKASVARLRAMAIRRVYPGHGGPFVMGEVL